MQRSSVWSRWMGPLALGVALAGLPASANQNGQFQRCDSCHSGGTTPTVAISLSDTTPEVGQTVQVTVTVSTPNGNRAGFWLQMGTGLLTNRAGEGTQVQGSTQASHTSPKVVNSGDDVTFTLDWKPTTAGSFNATAWGNSVNGNGQDGFGDAARSFTLPVQVTCAGGVAPTTYYRDRDNDGVGSTASGTTSACALPTGYSTLNTDCNDNDSTIKPGATEVCNGKDDNCNAQTDEDLALITVYRDADKDGFGTAADTTQACGPVGGYVANADDCDDTKASVHPGATELCNGADEDCDGQNDEDVQLASYYPDTDGDGFGANVEAVVDCKPPQPGTFVTNAEDCDDTQASVKPGATEVCNGTDDNCDGTADEGVTVPTWYRDADGDGFGNDAMTQQSCTQPAGYVAQSETTDCDDDFAEVHPGATEVCNGADENCDGVPDNATGSSSLCPAGQVCNADEGMCVADPSGTADAGTNGPDAGVTADAGTGGEKPEAGGCTASGAGSLVWGGLLLALLVALRPRRRADA